MAGIRKLLLPWDSQPQEAVGVDWGNPLASGLIFVYHAPSGSLVGPELPSVGTTTKGVSAGGIALQVAGAGYLGNTLPTGLALPMTFGALAYTSSTGTSQTLLSAGRSGVDDVYFQLGLNVGGTVRAASRATTYIAANSSNAVSANRPFVAAAVYSSTTSRSAFLNGTLSAPETTSSSPSSINSFRLGTLARFTPGDYLNGGLLLGAVWDRALSASELRSWSDNPWQLFAPRRIWVPVAAAGGGGTTYTQNASGIFTPASALNFSAIYGRALGGITTATGNISRQTSKIFLGSYTPSATVVKQTNTTEGGSITSSSGLGASTGAEQGVAGSITVSAVTTTSVTFRRVYVAALSLAGSITKLVSKNVGGALALAGIAFKRTTRAFAGVISATGTLSGLKFTPVLGGLVTKGLRFMRKYIGRR